MDEIRREQIHTKIQEALDPVFAELIDLNETHMAMEGMFIYITDIVIDTSPAHTQLNEQFAFLNGMLLTM